MQEITRVKKFLTVQNQEKDDIVNYTVRMIRN